MVGSTHAMVPSGYPVDIGGLVNARDFWRLLGMGNHLRPVSAQKVPSHSTYWWLIMTYSSRTNIL